MNYSSSDEMNNTANDDTNDSLNNSLITVLTGEKIGKSAQEILQKNEINMQCCVGISTQLYLHKL